MDEKEWLECDNPVKKLESLRGKVSDRKRRLVVVAWGRLLWDRLSHEERRHYEVIERFADGVASEKELLAASREAEAGIRQTNPFYYPDYQTLNATSLAMLRDICRNLFRPVTVDATCLIPTVTALAQGIYNDRTFTDLPILADALEKAGCTNADILNHCHQPGEHVRGCWVVDLVLGKE